MSDAAYTTMLQVALSSLRSLSRVTWALADQMMVSGVNFLTGILLARFLGLREFGVFTLAWIAIVFLYNLQIAIITSPMMSIGPKQSEQELPAYYGAVFAQQVAFSLLASLIIFVSVELSGVFFPEWRVQHLALPLAFVAFFLQMQDFLRRYFFTCGRGSAAFANDAISYLGQLGLLLWLFQITQLNSAGALWVIAGTSTMAVLVGAISLGRMAWDWKLVCTVASRHLRFSKWLAASVLMQLTAVNLFIIVAASLLGAFAAGALKAAQNIMGILHILFHGLDNIVPAEASRRYDQMGIRALTGYLRKVAWFEGTATALFALLVGLFPEFWLGLFYGPEFLLYGALLKWYAAVYVIAFFGTPLRAWLRALEHTRPMFWATLGMMLFSIATAYPLNIWWGLTGTMLGIFISFVILQGILGIGIYHKNKELCVERNG